MGQSSQFEFQGLRRHALRRKSSKQGDEIRVARSGQTAKIKEIVTMDGALKQARQGDAVTLKLNKEIDVSRGDVLSLAQMPLEQSDQFEATLVWMHEDSDIRGETMISSSRPSGHKPPSRILNIRININTLSHDACKELELN